MKKQKLLSRVTIWMLLFVCVAPFGLVVIESFYQKSGHISFQAYYDVLLGSSQYLIRFWRSLSVCIWIVIGQVFVSILAGYGFAKYTFYGKKILFFSLIVLMVLPLQVTLIPNYIILDKMNLLGTNVSLIFPMIFVPLGTFLMTQSFRAVSDEILDAAKLDGCGTFQLIFQIAVPITRGSITCMGLLSFLDAWNMVEQPVAYLKEFSKYPISVALAYVETGNVRWQCACCLLVLLPPLFLFFCFHKEMVEGIVTGEAK